MELEERLVQLRKDHGLSQNELAERLNVSRQTISKWERGTVVPSGDNLISLSELYGITLDDLVHDRIQQKIEESLVERRAEPPKESVVFGLSKAKTWKTKQVVIVALCALLLGIAIGIISILDHGGEILPIQNLEHEQVNISEMEDIPNLR